MIVLSANTIWNHVTDTRRMRAPVTPRLGAAILIVSYVAWNLIAWGGQPAQETFDSYRYLGDWGLNFVAIFEPLNGGIATSLLYAVFPDPTAISLTQVLVSAIAWSLLALSVLYRLAGRWTAWVLAVVVLLISMHSVFWSAHFAVGAESLVLSAAVAWLASLVWVAAQTAPGVGSVLTMLLALFMIGLTRPQAFLALIPVQVVFLIWWARRERHSRVLSYAIPALLPMAAFAAYRVWQVSQHDRWPFRYALHNLVDKPPSFRTYALERIPDCAAIPAALNGAAPWNDVLALEGTLASQCPDTYLWFQSDAISVWNWVPSMPLETVRNFIDVMPALQLSRWNEILALPAGLDNAVMPNSNPWIYALSSLLVGIALALLGGIRPHVTWLSIAGSAIVVACAIGFVFLVWAADGVDHGRHVFPILPVVGVAALLMPSVIPARTRE